MEGNKKIKLKEAAEIYGYNVKYLSKLIRSGKLKGEKIGRNWVIKESELNLMVPKKRGTNSESQSLDLKYEADNRDAPLVPVGNKRQLALSALVLLLAISFAFSILLTLGNFSSAKKSAIKDSNYIPTEQEKILRHSIFGD